MNRITPVLPAHNLPLRVLLTTISILLAVLLVGYEYLLLQWPMLREAHFLHYVGYLINEHDFVPYRDVLETSWFGTILFHRLIGKLFGYTAIGFRWADIVFLMILSSITWHVLKPFSKPAAWTGTLSAALTYIHFGPGNTLQRDFVLLLPIICSLLVAMQTNWPAMWRALMTGVLFGMAASIKPHAIIGLPPVLMFLYSQTDQPRKPWRCLLYCCAGGCLTFGSGLLWLWLRGGLSAFIDMSVHYLPLYQSFNGAHEIVLSTDERWKNSIHWWLYFLWLWPYTVTAGLVWGWWNTRHMNQARALLLTLVALTVCYNIYPLLAGKFWDYHWIPYSCFAALASTALLIPAQTPSLLRNIASASAIFYFLLVLTNQYMPGRVISEQLGHFPDTHIDQTNEKQVGDFIREHMPPGGRIQIIEQGGPATLYLLQARVPLATPYLGSFMFLHHTDTPYVQHAQQDFLQRLNEKPPELFLVMNNFTKPSGPGTIKEIPGLKDFLDAHYEAIWKTGGFVIWQYRQKNITSE